MTSSCGKKRKYAEKSETKFNSIQYLFLLTFFCFILHLIRKVNKNLIKFLNTHKMKYKKNRRRKQAFK